jgi:hypothetical protein
MAVDPNLIKSVSQAYKYKNFVPDNSAVLKGLETYAENTRQAKKQRIIQEENIQKEVKGYIDKYPPGIPLSKIPEKYRSSISKFSFEQKDIYSKAASSRARMKAGSDEYQEQTDLMNGALQSVSNLKNQWDTFGQGKEENLGDFDSQNYSKGNNSDNLGLYASLYTDKFDASIGESGDLSFTTEDGGSFKLSDLDPPFLKAADEAMYVETQLVSAYDKGVRLSDASINLTMSQIKKVVNKGGVDALKSLAIDDLVGGVSLYEPDNEIFKRIDSDDPSISLEAKSELEQNLYSTYRNSLVKQANEGYSVKNPVEIKEPTSKEAFNSLASSDPEKYSLLLNNLGDENKSMLAGTELQRNLNMQALRYSGYYTEYDKETNSFMLFDKNEKQDFQDEGASYPATPQGINQLLNEVDSSRR